MINLRALSYLVALGEHHSFSRAAEHCCITQSTLSIQLRKLEDYLGVELVDRTPPRIRLTSAGRQVCHLAQMILATTGEIQLVAQRARAASARQPVIDDINCLRPPKD
jgi:LysR family hydrogen peroxide-inducible transcriptional activator